jgi:hypothetical protein
MDTLAIASLATEMAQTTTQQAAQLAVLKKAMNIEAQGAAQLVQAAAQVMQASNPAHLGNAVDLYV